MKTPLRSLSLRTFAASIMLFAFGGCSPHKTAPSAGEQLLTASKAAGIEIRADEILTISRGAESFVAAPTTAWAQIPARELRNGVTFAFAYLPAPAPEVPAGYYTLKAFASDIRVGTVESKVQLIDRQGKVATEIPAEIEIHSLEVPPGSRTSFIALRPGNRIRPWFRCSNGQCIGVLIPILVAREP